MSTPVRMLGNKYRIDAEIGRGGMGVVYRGFDTSLNRPVAIKVLPAELTYDQEFVKRFNQEARGAAQLRHPGIVTVHDVGEQNGTYYMIQEFLEGVTMERWLQQQPPLAPVQIENLIRQIADALDYAHDRGVIHRDIKPANIMISSEGRATIMDFGLVRAGEGANLTRTGVVMGTPEYMAPEQALGTQTDRRCDIYSFGVVIYRALSGKVPFARTTAFAVTYAHVHEAPPPIRQSRPEIPEAVEAVIGKAMAKRPEDRYQRAGLLADDFCAAAEGRAPAFGATPPTAVKADSAPGARPGVPRNGAPVAAGVSPAGGVTPARMPVAAAGAAVARAGTPALGTVAAAPAERRKSRAPIAVLAGLAILGVAAGGLFLVLSRSGAQATPTVQVTPALQLQPSTATPRPILIAGTALPGTTATSTGLRPSATPVPGPTGAAKQAATVASGARGGKILHLPIIGRDDRLAVQVRSSDINLRAGPGTNFDIVGQARAGQTYMVESRNPDASWVQITVDGKLGWVASGLTNAFGDLNKAPVRSP